MLLGLSLLLMLTLMLLGFAVFGWCIFGGGGALLSFSFPLLSVYFFLFISIDISLMIFFCKLMSLFPFVKSS